MEGEEGNESFEVVFYEPEDLNRDHRRLWPEDIDVDKWEGTSQRLRDLCPVLCPNMMHQEMADGSIWAVAHLLGGGEPDPVLRPKAKGPQAVILLKKRLKKMQTGGSSASCGVCGRQGKLSLSNTGSSLAVSPGDASPADAEDVLRPLLLGNTSWGDKSVAVDRVLPACTTCRLLSSPWAFVQLLANHTLLHITDSDAAESKQDEASGFMSRLATHFAEVNNIDAPSEIEALAVLKAAMDAAYSASSLATKHAGWRVVGPGGERLNAKDFVGLVVDMMVGEGKGEGNGVRAAGEKKKGGRRKSESGKGK